MKRLAARLDPAPSVWSYRFQRLMLTPLFRRVLRVGLPMGLGLTLGLFYLSDADRQARLAQALTDLRQQIETRPEFMVDLLEVEGASATLEAEIRDAFPYSFPISSFDLDLDAVRRLVAGMPPVSDVSLRIRRGGVVVAQVNERLPAALWRGRDGVRVIDAEGVAIGQAAARRDHPELPVLAGKGADAAVAEALGILEAAEPLGSRVRGLVRMGQRRWDLVLDRAQRILLPAEAPVRALERVIVLQQVQDMLERDVAVVDMRLPERPTVRMTEHAVEKWRQVTRTSAGADRQ